MLLSPLTIRLLHYMSTQIVCFTGTLLASLGLYLASKASSIWFLYMTFGVMHGIGTNLCYMSAIWIVRKNFQKHRDVAFGLASAGTGAGGVFFSIMLPIFVESRGWRGALEIVSYITLPFVVVSMVMVEVQQGSEKGGKVEEKKRLFSWKPSLKGMRVSTPSPWRNRPFAVLSVAILLCTFVSSIPYCHIVNYALHQGVRRSESDRLPLFISTGSLIGRIFVGRLSGFRRVSRITLCQVTFLILSIATTLCTLANNTGSLVTFCLVFGVFEGAFNCMLALVVDDVFVDKNQAMKAIGQLFQLLAFPYAFGAPLAGWLYSLTGGYHVPFFICGGILFVAAILVSLARYLLEPAHSAAVLSLPEKIVISPAVENSGDLVPVLHRNSSRILSSRACSFIDLAVEVYAENLHRSSSHLAVSQEHPQHTMNKRQSKFCSQDHLKADDSTAVYRMENDYTDINNQISGLTNTKHAVMVTGDAWFSTNKNEGFCRQKDYNGVVVSVSSNQNEDPSRQENNDVAVVIPPIRNEESSQLENNDDVIISDGRIPDPSWVDYRDSDVLKRSSSGVSIDDAGYFSSVAPTNYGDSDTQSTGSQCGVSMNLVSKEGSLDSFMKIDCMENENFIDEAFCGSSEDLETVGLLERMEEYGNTDLTS